MEKKKSMTSAGLGYSEVQPVASRCTDCAIAALFMPLMPVLILFSYLILVLPSDFFPQLLRPKLFEHFSSSHRDLLDARLQPEVNIRNSWCIFVYNAHFLHFSGSKLVLDHFGSVPIQIKGGHLSDLCISFGVLNIMT
jgi:hypothetical protein